MFSIAKRLTIPFFKPIRFNASIIAFRVSKFPSAKKVKGIDKGEVLEVKKGGKGSKDSYIVERNDNDARRGGLMYATINHAVRIKKVGVYQSIIEIIDDQTGERIIYIERNHPKRGRPAVAKSSLKEALEIVEEKGYIVSEINSTDP